MTIQHPLKAAWSVLCERIRRAKFNDRSPCQLYLWFLTNGSSEIKKYDCELLSWLMQTQHELVSWQIWIFCLSYRVLLMAAVVKPCLYEMLPRASPTTIREFSWESFQTVGQSRLGPQNEKDHWSGIYRKRFKDALVSSEGQDYRGNLEAQTFFSDRFYKCYVKYSKPPLHPIFKLTFSPL